MPGVDSPQSSPRVDTRLMIAIGPESFRSMLDGFHQMDVHFRTAPFEHNLPHLRELFAEDPKRVTV
jgi:glucose-6-phosphate isomerase